MTLPAKEIAAASEIPLPRGPSIDAFDGRWCVLHTRSRNEKVIAAELLRQGVAHFLPLIRVPRIYAGRHRTVEIPLFPCYVFLCGADAERQIALRTDRVANILEVPDQDGLRADLSRIQQVVESDVPVDLYPRLRSGARCRVISGSLIGLEGIVLRRRGPWKVFVGVQFVGQSAELEIDSSHLEVID